MVRTVPFLTLHRQFFGSSLEYHDQPQQWLVCRCYDLYNRRGTPMAIETVGKFQLHLIAYELPGSGKWDPFVTIHKFEDEIQDFICIVEKYHASDQAFETYDEAIAEARRAGNALIGAAES
jgi:hypothetical protein